ncbi:MAG: sulfatase-like hydrolase/transferase [Lentisphaeria bacterium]|nr:sulfatase-like hydrolase/transferase [Lentisphaeria bacterium]
MIKMMRRIAPAAMSMGPMLLPSSQCLAANEGVASEPKRPNIIFILSDDISPKDYALYGGKTASPVLERMGRNGVFFKTAWATPRCIPTRATLLTGKYPFRTKVYENQVYPRGKDNWIKPVGQRFPNTLGSLMTANGYRTAFIGKIQTGDVKSYGFERWCTVNHGHIFDMSFSDNNVDGKQVVREDTHSTDSLFDYLHDFTAEKSQSPWFVYMPLNLPHWVRNPDNPDKWGPPLVPELDANWQKTGRLVQNDFGACIRYIDYKIGGFINHLEATGQLQNTVIMYAGDNGSTGYGKSNPDSEVGPRVPFVVYAPGMLKSTGASDELIDFTDVLPTCVELAGGTLPEEDIFDGHSFAPLILGKPFDGREWIFSQWYGCRWLRTKRWLIDGRGRFYDCGDNRNEWGEGAYQDVTQSKDANVIAARKRLEKILEKRPAPDYQDPELADQWKREWLGQERFVQPFVPPYLNKKR